MTSYLKIFLIFLFAFFVTISMSLAVDTNISDFNSTDSDLNSIGDDSQTFDTTENSAVDLNTSDNTSLTSDSQSLNLDDLPESDLGLSNILSIILIAVGLVLILLGVAIIIKLK